MGGHTTSEHVTAAVCTTVSKYHNKMHCAPQKFHSTTVNLLYHTTIQWHHSREADPHHSNRLHWVAHCHNTTIVPQSQLNSTRVWIIFKQWHPTKGSTLCYIPPTSVPSSNRSSRHVILDSGFCITGKSASSQISLGASGLMYRGIEAPGQNRPFRFLIFYVFFLYFVLCLYYVCTA